LLVALSTIHTNGARYGSFQETQIIRARFDPQSQQRTQEILGGSPQARIQAEESDTQAHQQNGERRSAGKARC
jgi:hypothetical protein